MAGYLVARCWPPLRHFRRPTCRGTRKFPRNVHHKHSSGPPGGEKKNEETPPYSFYPLLRVVAPSRRKNLDGFGERRLSLLRKSSIVCRKGRNLGEFVKSGSTPGHPHISPRCALARAWPSDRGVRPHECGAKIA